jgi:hypothetical protein
MKILTKTALFFISILVAGAQPTPGRTSTFSKLAGVQAADIVKKLDRKQLPVGAKIQINPNQQFLLHSPDAENLAVLPIYFHYEPPSGQLVLSSQCGVFFVRPNGESHYVSVKGPDPHISNLCGGVLAIGSMPDPGSRPRLIFIMAAIAPDGNQYAEPYVLTWEAGVAEYKVDRKTSDWLVSQSKSDTVAEVRRLLAHHP